MLDAGSWILDLDIANGQLHMVILSSLISNRYSVFSVVKKSVSY